MPQAVLAATDFGVLDQRRVGRVGSKVRLVFGSQAIVLRERDYTALVQAAAHLAAPQQPVANTTPPAVPPPPSAYGRAENSGF
jgi:hypothetical protein